jgi:hypothetical protein
MCPQSCSLATAVVLTRVYTFTWQWVYMHSTMHLGLSWEYGFLARREPDVSEEHITSILRVEK